MTQIKEQVLAYFRHDRKFETGARLLNQYGTNANLKARINQAIQYGQTSDKLIYGMLNEALAELAGISVAVMQNFLRQPLVPLPIDLVEDPTFKAPPAAKQTAAAEPSRAEQLAELKADELVEAITKLKPEFQKKKEKKADLVAILIELEAVRDLADAKAQDATAAGAEAGGQQDPAQSTGEPAEGAAGEVVVPVNVQKAIKLREEFPFLTQRDCPAVLKALVGTMLEAYDQFRFAHEDLFAAEGFEAEQKAALAAIDNYLENQSIWNELKYYRDNGTLLGAHPDVRLVIDQKEVEALSALDLAKEKSNLQKSINLDKGKLKKEQELGEAADPEKVAAIEQRIAQKESRLALVVERLSKL